MNGNNMLDNTQVSVVPFCYVKSCRHFVEVVCSVSLPSDICNTKRIIPWLFILGSSSMCYITVCDVSYSILAHSLPQRPFYVHSEGGTTWQIEDVTQRLYARYVCVSSSSYYCTAAAALLRAKSPRTGWYNFSTRKTLCTRQEQLPCPRGAYRRQQTLGNRWTGADRGGGVGRQTVRPCKITTSRSV